MSPGWLLLILVVCGLVLLWTVLMARPSHGRDWAVEQSILPEFVLANETLIIKGFRDFNWISSTHFEPHWEERSFDLRELRAVWYILTPFSRSWRGLAHSFLSFQFGDDTFLAISVEARRQAGEKYGLFKGLLRRFELMYVAGSERDLVGLRAVHQGVPVLVYPLDVDPSGVRALLESMATSANALRIQPEFYNTITNNCTTRIIRHVDRVAPGRVPRSWQLVLPGYSDALAYRLGLIDTDLSLQDARIRWLINDRAVRAWDDPDFGRRIREAP